MNDIEQLLKTEEQDFWISEDERKHLIDVLSFIAAALFDGTIWFNKPGKENLEHSRFCAEIAQRFTNMPIHKEN